VNGAFYKRTCPYCEEMPEMIIADYIASMTDDYFIDLFTHLFPKSKLKIEYRGYFDK
jgi:dGTPase